MHELQQTIWLETPKGIGLAIMIEDRGIEHSLYWVTIDEATGQIWSWPNERVRAVKNVTLDRFNPEKPERYRPPPRRRPR